jgi:gamma-glutamyl-gamma-aminobutyrate hydrolase PuuD
LKIGLSQRIFEHKGRAYDSIEHGWYSYLKEHTLIFIPNNPEQDFKKLAQELDAFIITGGDDSAVRRLTELNLATEMTKQQKPIIGICHGCFLLTQVLGGQVEEISGHMDTEHIINYNNKQIVVNSYHTLCVQQVPPNAKILATDEQGLCEAWIDANVAGVTWHPERMSQAFLPEEIENLIKDIK